MNIRILLIGIVLFAAVLRLYNIGLTPPSPDWDEAALGYNAYSILHTGQDEYGKTLPLVFQSFGDYKPGLYVYLTIPFIQVFGLNIIAVRLVSILFGIVAVIGTYILVDELFKNKRYALLSAFFLAISPWHIQFSRVGFEANVGLTLNIFMVLLFIKGMKNKWLILLSGIIAGLNIYVYQSEKVFTPLLFIICLLLYRKRIFAHSLQTYAYTSWILFLIIILPMVVFLLKQPQALSRATSTSIFSSQKNIVINTPERILSDKKNGDIIGELIDNKRGEYFKSIISGYLKHYNVNWLFITGDQARHHAPFMGLLYLWELPLLLTGLYIVISKIITRKEMVNEYILLLSWFFIAPIQASVTQDVPHALRTLNFLTTFQVFTSIGLIAVVLFIQNKIKTGYIRNGIYIFFGFLIIFNFFYYLDQYFVQQDFYYSEDWQYGYKQAVQTVKQLAPEYNKI